MFYQILFSPQLKGCVIISYKHSIHKLINELPNNLRLRKLENIRKVLKPYRIIAHKTKSPLIPAKPPAKQKLNPSRSALLGTKTTL